MSCSSNLDELTEHVFQQLKPFLSNKLTQSAIAAKRLRGPEARRSPSSVTVDINDTISAHGSNPDMFDDIVLSICTFEDLCKFGKAFIENRVPRHIDYYGEFGKAEDSNGHGIERENLAKIHDYNVLTTNGQCNLKLDDEEQRGYLDFYCNTTIANKLRERLFNDSRIYTVDFGTVENERQCKHNFLCISRESCPQHVKSCKTLGCILNLSKYINSETNKWTYFTNLFTDSHPREMFNPEYLNICTVLNNKHYFSIANREYGALTNCSDVLLEHLKQIART
jgi:hypothetical protein